MFQVSAWKISSKRTTRIFVSEWANSFFLFFPQTNCLSSHLLLLLTSCCAALSSKGKGKWKLISCPWRWKPQYPGCLALFRSTFPMQSSPFPSKNDECLFPHHLHQIQRVLPLPGFHFLCRHSHHPKGAPHWAGCSPSSCPLGHLCLFPLQILLHQTLCMIPTNSNLISISASLIWACWGEDHLERYTR